MEFTDQKVGVPNMCTHVFCLACIQEWAKVGVVEMTLVKTFKQHSDYSIETTLKKDLTLLSLD